MKKLGEILDLLNDDKEITEEEAKYTILALFSLLNMDHSSLRDVTIGRRKDSEIFKKLESKHSFDRYKRALDSDPKVWIGQDNDPKYEDVRKRKQAAKKLVDCLIGK